MIKRSFTYLLPLMAGWILLQFPLVRDLHFESAMVAGTIGCFWAGIRFSHPQIKATLSGVWGIIRAVYLSSLPLLIHALITQCLTLDGIGFWVVIPLPSIFLGASIGRFFRILWFPFPRVLSVLVLLYLALGSLMVEIYLLPQIYFYNHVWGIWPGPIYDEAVHFTSAILYYRGLTILLTLLLWNLPSWKRNVWPKTMVVISLLLLAIGYSNLSNMGIISPPQKIRQSLDQTHNTEHFNLYYSSEYFTDQEIEHLALEHEFYFSAINTILEIDWPKDRKIDSYLYGHAWQKKLLTGAKFTSYVPIWLEQDQLHIAKQQLRGTLKHELVHVISKQFGNRLLNGSYSIGMIEGLAEGIAKDASSRSTLHQIIGSNNQLPSAASLQDLFSLQGFYTQAGSISYTMAGSFIQYLLNNYPVQYLKRAYASGDVEEHYPVPLEQLVSEWHQVIQSTPQDSIDREVSDYIFAQRSLFQKPCPHSITKELFLWDRYQFNLADGDTLLAHQFLDSLYVIDSENSLVKNHWIKAQLNTGNYRAVISSVSPKDSLLDLQVLKADAYYLSGSFSDADSLLRRLEPRILDSDQRSFEYTLNMRSDSLQWGYLTRGRYQNVYPEPSSFPRLNFANQMITVDHTLKNNQTTLFLNYLSHLSLLDLHESWFDLYDQVIKELIHLKKFDLAHDWIDSTSKLDLRLRYQERLNENIQRLQFLKNR